METLLDPSLDKQLTRGLDALAIKLDVKTQRALLDYLALIEKWNKVYNLTAVREVEKMVSHHLLDSLAVLPHIHAKRLLDVGSGAGLPGIPLALARRQMQVVLMDSNHKKTVFLQQAIIDLQLTNTSVQWGRVEDWVIENEADKFDLIISRAFADLASLVNLSGHLLAENATIAALKGVYPHEELSQIPKGFNIKEVIPLQVPGLDAKRNLVLITKK